VAIVVAAVILAQTVVEVVVPRRMLRAILALRRMTETERLLVLGEGVLRAGGLGHGVAYILIEIASPVRAEVMFRLLPVVPESSLHSVPCTVVLVRVPRWT